MPPCLFTGQFLRKADILLVIRSMAYNNEDQNPQTAAGERRGIGWGRWNLRLSVVHGPFVSYYTSIGHQEFIALLPLCAIFTKTLLFTELSVYKMV
jgi:hypothetical protein